MTDIDMECLHCGLLNTVTIDDESISNIMDESHLETYEVKTICKFCNLEFPVVTFMAMIHDGENWHWLKRSKSREWMGEIIK